MPTQRVFLDWTKPALDQAAHWLLEQPAQSDNLLVLPGSRAGRRLMELLLTRSGGHLIDPPALTTIGSLADKLIAGLPETSCPTVLRLVLVTALKQLPTEHLDVLVPNAPATGQLLAWLNLATPIEKMFNTLAAGGLLPGDVMQLATQWPDFTQAQRWQAITALHGLYSQLLAEHDLHDLNLQRINALAEQRIAFTGRITLVCTADINPLTIAMLNQVSDCCTTLIHAPQSREKYFGHFGELDNVYWHQQPLNIPAEKRIVVDQPKDQIAAMLMDLKTFSEQIKLTTDTLTLGVGDEKLGPLLEQLSVATGLNTRWHQQRDILLSGPVSLLQAFNQYCKSNLSTDLSLLLRHPDMQLYLHQQIPMSDHTLLDKYLGEHLQNKISPDAPGLTGPKDGEHPLLKTAHIIDTLVEKHLAQQGSLSHWAQCISNLLTEIYTPLTLNPNVEQDVPVIDPLSQIASILRTWFTPTPALGSLEPQDISGASGGDVLPQYLSFEHAGELLRCELANTPLARPNGKPAVEILGWLELHMDDAPNLYILNFNEGSIPGDVRIDPFLPDSICQQLGLTCDKSRLARDRYMLEAILYSRDYLRIIAGKTNLSHEPMLPSRLMLLCDDEKLAPTVLDYFEPKILKLAPLLPSNKQSELTIPKPPPITHPLTKLSITAFRAYLDCPYRFYLRYICKLKKPSPYLPELSPPAFGILAHNVLQHFGQSDMIDCTEHQTLSQYFSEVLDQLCESTYGQHPLPAIAIQREQLRQRLSVFAKFQARMRSDGWRIIQEKIESKFTVDFPVDNKPFTLIGRIDRMDRHTDTGELRIMDYKTSESSKKPDATHRTKNADGSKTWIDLQLPLYHLLAASEIYNQKVQLGYCQLGKQLDKIGFEPALWTPDEISEAVAIAQDVIRQIRAGILWPPSDPPAYEDGLEGICHDAYPLRKHEINQMQLQNRGDA